MIQFLLDFLCVQVYDRSHYNMALNIQKNLKLILVLPVALSIAAAAVLFIWPPKLGLDLAGGSLLHISYPAEAVPSSNDIAKALETLELGAIRIQPAGEHGYMMRQRDLTNEEKSRVISTLGSLGVVTEEQYTSIGPSIGSELLRKGLVALVLVLVSIILFIAFAFRHVSKPVASWKYGVVAIVTLLHDVLIPVGLFALLGHYLGAEIDSLFIVALLTILGISINDTIVVFDRIRENLRSNAEHNKREDFETVVETSITQTLARSFNTSLTVIIMLVALYVVGPVATKDFALTLMVGMVAGTYSSILLAAPLLVLWSRIRPSVSKKNN